MSLVFPPIKSISETPTKPRKTKKIRRTKSICDPEIKNNPFQLSKDTDLLVSLESINKHKEMEKEKRNKYKIWEKNTANTRHSYNKVNIDEICEKYNSFEFPDLSQKKLNYSSNKKQKNEALEIIHNRVPDKYTIKNKKLEKIKEEEKELFSISLSSSIIKKQINEIQNQIKLKDVAFNESLKLLDSHHKKLNELIEADSIIAKKKTDELDSIIKQKFEIIEEYNKLVHEETVRKGNIIKSEEKLKIVEEYKTFLDSITPKEILNSFEDSFKKKFQELKIEFFKSKNMDETSDKSSEVSKSTSSLRSKVSPSKMKIISPKKGGGELSKKELLNREFLYLFEHGQLNNINPYEGEFYFRTIENLRDEMIEREDENLDLLKRIKDLENSIENEKHNREKLKKILNGKCESVMKEKLAFERYAKDEEDSLKQIQIMEEKENKNKTNENYLNQIGIKIQQLYLKIEPKGDYKLKNYVSMFETIEQKLENLLIQMQGYEGKELTKLEQERYILRKQNVKQELLQKKYDENEEKKILAEERQRRPIVKISEKPLMPKSKPLEKLKKLVETKKIEDYDEMKKYFDDI